MKPSERPTSSVSPPAWSIARKTAYLKSKNLLGAMIWEMSGDTSNGALITALDNGLK